MAESAHVNNESESDSDSVSVNSAEPEESDRYLVTWMMKLNF